MQRSLNRSPRLPLAWLTLCAVAAPTSPAWAEPMRLRDPISSLAGALADDEELGASSEPSVAAPIDDEGQADLTASTATASGGSSATRTLVMPSAFANGSTRGPLASFSLPNLPSLSTEAPAETAAPAAPPPAGADDGTGLRTAGFVAGGVGLAGLALFAIAGLGAKSAYDKLETECGGVPCTDEAHRSDIEGGKMLQTAANIGLAAGLTGLGVGATLLVLGSRSPAEKRGPSASVSASGAMLTYGGHF